MRAIAIISLLVLAALPACDSSTSKLKDVSWGGEFDGDYQAVLDRTRYVLAKQFPLGLDPDLSSEEAGEFWTVWHYHMSAWYRESKRVRAHIKVEDAGSGKVRLGVAVVSQLNDNIDNPSIKEEARWVRTSRDPEWASRLENSIARRYLKVEPSKYWEEKHLPKKRETMREDILDRNKDVDLEELERPDRPDKQPPKTTGIDEDDD